MVLVPMPKEQKTSGVRAGPVCFSFDGPLDKCRDKAQVKHSHKKTGSVALRLPQYPVWDQLQSVLKLSWTGFFGFVVAREW